MTPSRPSFVRAASFGLMLAIGGCVAPYPSYRPLAPPRPVGSYPNVTRSQTDGLENADRVARFQRLASISGIAPPQVDQMYAPAATDPDIAGPVPVVRVVFDERVFFDSGSDVPRPEALSVIDTIAQNMHKDVPDAQVTVLGHTDAVGGDAYNMALSERRALSVLRGLADRGVDPGQLSTVAIGKRQPLATNGTPQGRARNRRVEFLISASLPANLAVVQQRPIDLALLSTGEESAADPAAPSTVEVLRPTRVPDGGLALRQSQVLDLHYEQAVARPSPAAKAPVHRYVPASLGPARRPVVNTPAPAPHYVPNTPEEFQKQDLGPAQTF